MNATKNDNASKARKYLVYIAGTKTGREILAELGYEAIIDAPTRGDDASTILIADAVESAWSLRNRDPLARDERYKTAEDLAYDNRMAGYAKYAAYRPGAGLAVPSKSEYASRLTTEEVNRFRD